MTPSTGIPLESTADFKDGEYTEYYDQVVVDTGIEWQIWDIVKLPE